MQQISYKLPFQLDGQDAWVNNDAQELSRAGTPFGSGANCDWYVGNGPCGQATQLWSGVLWQNSGWWTTSTAAERWKWAHDTAGVPRTPLPVCPTAVAPAPTKSLQDWLGSTLYGLLTQPVPPSNLRGLILAKTQLWVPEEVTDVVGWLEQNRPVAPAQTVKVEATARTGTARPYRLEASRTQRVYGRCSYSATENQTQSHRLSEAELAEIIDSAGDQDEALRLLQDWLNNGDWDIDSEDRHEYEDHEAQDYGDTDGEEDNAKEILAQFFADHPEHDPEREEDDDEEEEVEETPVPM